VLEGIPMGGPQSKVHVGHTGGIILYGEDNKVAHRCVVKATLSEVAGSHRLHGGILLPWPNMS